MDRWIIHWIGDSVVANEQHYMTADSPQEVTELIREVLHGETWTDPDDADEPAEEIAFHVFLVHLCVPHCDEANLPAILHATVSDIEFRCDNGTLKVIRDRVAEQFLAGVAFNIARPGR
jgi:hypothetical protein